MCDYKDALLSQVVSWRVLGLLCKMVPRLQTAGICFYCRVCFHLYETWSTAAKLKKNKTHPASTTIKSCLPLVVGWWLVVVCCPLFFFFYFLLFYFFKIKKKKENASSCTASVMRFWPWRATVYPRMERLSCPLCTCSPARGFFFFFFFFFKIFIVCVCVFCLCDGQETQPNKRHSPEAIESQNNHLHAIIPSRKRVVCMVTITNPLSRSVGWAFSSAKLSISSDSAIIFIPRRKKQINPINGTRQSQLRSFGHTSLKANPT